MNATALTVNAAFTQKTTVMLKLLQLHTSRNLNLPSDSVRETEGESG
uniref:Uncharacterized protein n=1 Tax=Anguilla anguilla TaxID=7936 RepID=A0A0E9XKN3_ANGAN